MSLANNDVRYGGVSRALHWLTLLLVIVLLITGKSDAMEVDEAGNAAFMWHASLGVLVFVLSIVRVIWIVISPPPPLPPEVSYAFRAAAVASHVVLYGLLLVLPVSGWVAASEQGAAINFFNVATLPRSTMTTIPAVAPQVDIAHEQEQSAERNGHRHGESAAEEIHEVLGNVLLVLASLHALAAILHHFVGRNGMLLRMLPPRRSV